MGRFRDLLIMIGAGCVLPGSTLVLGHTQEGALGSRPTVVLPPVAVKRQEVFSKVEVAKRQGEPARPVPKAAVPTKAVRVPARVRAQPAPAVLEARAARVVPQMWSIFRSEYYFIRYACDLNVDQRKTLARLGDSTIKAAARQFAEAEMKVSRVEEYPDPRTLIENELAKSVTTLLASGQQARYKDEIEKRAASRKQFVIDNLVARLDQDLVLSPDQRNRLVESLSTNWKDAWGRSVENLMRNDNFFPDIPDHIVVPILTDHQREVWGVLPIHRHHSFGISFARGIARGDPLDDPELAEAQKEATANNKK